MIHKIDNPLESCELKFAKDDNQFEGYASKFDGNDSVNDTIMKGAFEKTLKQARLPRMLLDHNPGRVIGKWLELHEDDNGLRAVGEFTPGHSDAQNAKASARHGAVDGLSIGFRIPKGGSEQKEDGGRNIKEIDLIEVSVVAFPADQDARIAVVKEEILEVKSFKDAEYLLRESGSFSRSMATAFVSQLNSIFQSDSDTAKDEQITELLAKLTEYERRQNVQTEISHLINRINGVRI